MSKKKGVCGICFLELDGDIIACPACKTKFHEDHLAAWLRLKNNKCPHCRDVLPKEFIEQLTPKTSEEKEYLDSLEYLFGDMARFNRITSEIETRRSMLKTNKIAYISLSLILLLSLPMSYIMVDSIYESSKIYIFIIVLLVSISINVIVVSLIIKIRRTIPELERLINKDRQRLLDL